MLLCVWVLTCRRIRESRQGVAVTGYLRVWPVDEDMASGGVVALGHLGSRGSQAGLTSAGVECRDRRGSVVPSNERLWF